MTDETRLGKAGTGVAKEGAQAVIRPEKMLLRRQITDAFVTLLLEPDPSAPAEAGSAIPVAQWLERFARGEDLRQVGVIIRGADDLSALKPHIGGLFCAALHYPIFSDGRAYSHAYRLRKTWGYQGPIIAFGDVLRDQLLYMSRVGIDGFYLRADQKPEDCLAAYRLYSAYYQYDDVAA